MVPRERSEFAEDCLAVRAALGLAAYEEAFAAGQALSLAQARDWVLQEIAVGADAGSDP